MTNIQIENLLSCLRNWKPNSERCSFGFCLFQKQGILYSLPCVDNHLLESHREYFSLCDWRQRGLFLFSVKGRKSLQPETSLNSAQILRVTQLEQE